MNLGSLKLSEVTPHTHTCTSPVHKLDWFAKLMWMLVQKILFWEIELKLG